MTKQEYFQKKAEAIELIVQKTRYGKIFTPEEEDLINFFDKHKKFEDITKYRLIRQSNERK